MQDEGRDRLGQLVSLLHDLQAQGDYFRLQQEAGDFRIIRFDESADNPQGSKAQVVHWPCFGDRIEEGKEENGDLRLEEL